MDSTFKKLNWDDGLKPCFKTICDNDEFIDNVKSAVENGIFELWGFGENAYMTTKVDVLMTGERALRVLDMCGKFTPHFKELSVFVEALAKTYKCKKVVVTTHRKALVKTYTENGFIVCDYVLERAVN